MFKSILIATSFIVASLVSYSPLHQSEWSVSDVLKSPAGITLEGSVAAACGPIPQARPGCIYVQLPLCRLALVCGNNK